MNASLASSPVTTYRKLGPIALSLWIASFIAGLLAFYFSPYLIALMDWPHELIPLIQAATIVGAVLGGISGLIIGVSQWLILLRILPWAGRWALATIIGWIIGGVMFLVFSWLDYWLFYEYIPQGERERPNPIYHVLLSALELGGVPIATGICQWLVLRRRLRGSNWWPIVTLLGWGIGPLLSSFGVSLFQDSPGSAPAWALYAIIAGAITGLALNWLLARNRPTSALLDRPSP